MMDFKPRKDVFLTNLIYVSEYISELDFYNYFEKIFYTKSPMKLKNLIRSITIDMEKLFNEIGIEFIKTSCYNSMYEIIENGIYTLCYNKIITKIKN